MIQPEAHHHETLGLIEQLILTGSIMVPCALTALDAARKRRANKKKLSTKGNK